MPEWAHIHEMKGAINNASTAPIEVDGVTLSTSLQMLHRVAGYNDPAQFDEVLSRVWTAQARLLEQPEVLLATGQRALQENGWPSDVALQDANIFWRPDKDVPPEKAHEGGQVSIRFPTPMVEEDTPDGGLIGYSGVEFDFMSTDSVGPMHKVYLDRLPKLAQAVQDAWRRENLTVTHPRYGRATPSRLATLKRRRVAGRKVDLLLYMCDASIDAFNTETLDQLIPLDKGIAAQSKTLKPQVAEALLPDWQEDTTEHKITEDDLRLECVMFSLTQGVLSEVSYDFRPPREIDPDSVFCARISLPDGMPAFALES